MSIIKIMIIRHGEKPNGDAGVTTAGKHDSEALTVRGWQRAGALVGLFAPAGERFANPRIAKPRCIFACGVTHESKSLRPQQTVVPLADKLGLAIDTSFSKGDESELARAAIAVGGVVLISWDHKHIPAIAAALLGDAGSYPRNWPDDRYDLVWVFDRPALSAICCLVQVPQLLLAGDSTEPIELS
jgi:broad specificity phosphatase PhoE